MVRTLLSDDSFLLCPVFAEPCGAEAAVVTLFLDVLYVVTSHSLMHCTAVYFRLGEVDEGMKNAQDLLVKQNTQVRHQKPILSLPIFLF